jgi:membrane associated rhomboid family serine protease
MLADKPVITYLILGITCLVSYLAWKSPRLAQRLILWPPAITRGKEVDRLVTHGFIHADAMHLIFNMVTLYFFGRAVEPVFVARIGHAGFLAFYIVAIVVAILPTYLRHRGDASYRSLGASGAVSAVLFSFILFAPWAMIIVFVVPVPAILYAVLYVGYSIWMDRRASDNVNHSAHLWGALFGVVATLVIEPRAWTVFMQQLANPRFG